MNTRNLLLLFILLVCVEQVYTQCTSCTPDPLLFPSPGAQDVDLTPDNVTVVQGEDTSIVLQYLMPLEVDAGIAIASVTSITILSVNGLPIGLDWECNLSGSGCFYEPQVNRFGCVTLCGNTIAPPGVYPISVLVDGCGSALGQTQCQNQEITLALTVVAPPGGNPGFSFNPGAGCDSATIDFEAKLQPPHPILNPITFDWDMGGGNVDAGEETSFYYSSPGDYEVTMDATIHELYISNVTASIVGNWYWQEALGDGTIFGQTSEADLVGSITSGSNNVNLPEVSNNDNPSWSIDMILASTSVAISYIENDGALIDDDNGGVGTIEVTGPGNYPYQTFFGGEIRTSGIITVDSRPISTQSFTDTIPILPLSVTPVVSNMSNSDTFCVGESIVLESSVSESYQWFVGGELIQGETNQTYTVTEPGVYAVSVVDAGTICPTMSDSIVIYAVDVDQPEIEVDNVNGGLTVNNSNNYDVQWFSDGIPIPGATSNTLSDLSSGGPFTVSFTNAQGCVSLSSSFAVCLAGTSTGSATVVNTSGGVMLEAEDFVVTNGNVIAWAFSSTSDGPVTDQASFQAAADNGWVFLGQTDTTFDVSCNNPTVPNGDYYATPILVEAPIVDSVIWDTAQNCVPSIEVCPDVNLDGEEWVLNPLTIQFPNGVDTSVLDLAGFPPLDITPQLIDDLLGGALPCFDFGDLYASFNSDPNGTWSLNATNIGTGTLVVTVPAFDVIVHADSCGLITEDQVYSYDGLTATIAPGETGSISFTLPPLPEDFPSVSPACEGYGSAVMVTFDGCPVGIKDGLSVVDRFALYPNPNNGQFTVDMEIQRPEEVTFAVYDYMGRKVYSKYYGIVQSHITESLDLGQYIEPGVYVLEAAVGSEKVLYRLMIH